MNYKIFIVILFMVMEIGSQACYAQKEVRSFIFGHSLIHHEFQVNITPSQETSVPHWMHFLAEAGGNDYATSGQYGFLPQHANLPPIAQWGFDFVEGAWDSDNEPFSDADFSNILITPGNFIQWQPPFENYPNESISPISATQTIFDWCIQQEDSILFYVYENWPDMASYLNNGFPPSSSEWVNYNEYLNDDFHNWFLEYHDSLVLHFPNSCVKMIPVGSIISKLLFEEPFNQIPIDSLYEDDAPHGRPTIYFLAALTTYMTMYEELAPQSFLPPDIIHPLVINNYEFVVNFIWDELNDFKDSEDNSKVFCNPLINTSQSNLGDIQRLKLFPNPSSGKIQIHGNDTQYFIKIYDGSNRLCNQFMTDSSLIFNMEDYQNGLYFIKIFNKKLEFLAVQKMLIFN